MPFVQQRRSYPADALARSRTADGDFLAFRASPGGHRSCDASRSGDLRVSNASEQLPKQTARAPLAEVCDRLVKAFAPNPQPNGAGSGKPGAYRQAREEVLEPEWILHLLRISISLVILSLIGNIAQFSYFDPVAARRALPYDLLKLAASFYAGVLTVKPWFLRRWRTTTLAFWLLLLFVSTSRSVTLTDQVSLFVATMAIETATCALVPWEIIWQAGLTAACIAAAMADTALVRPLSPYLGLMWFYLITVSLFTMAGSRSWARWRLALARAYRSLKDNESRMRKLLLDASQDQVSLLRLSDGRYIYVNDEFTKLGYPREEVLGKSAVELGMWANQTEFDQFRSKLNSQGSIRNQQVDVRMKDGRVVPHLMSSVLVQLDGEPSVLSVGRDITELKRTEQELIAAKEAALAASDAKSQFLSVISHEIRTPMNAILGMSELLAETPLSADQSRYIEIMTENGNALMELINSVLDLAKIESGRLHVDETEFDLGDLIKSVAETLGVQAHEKGLKFATRITPGVPRKLIGDRLRLRQVFLNLVGNAIKFTDHGEVALVVEKDPEAPESAGPRFAVSDTGIGIAPEKLEEIFYSFTQADSSTTRNYAGSGLGLSIAKRLVELMGGRIWVESKLGRGSTFYFTAGLEISASLPRQSTAAARALEGLRILVVDDNGANRETLREMLVAQGAEIEEAAGGTEALEKAERASKAGEPYGLMLLDCKMPGMDGFEVSERLAHRVGVPSPTIMMLTSEDLNSQLARVSQLGIPASLVKPVKRSELFRAIAQLTGVEHGSEEKAAPAPPPEPPAPQSAMRILLAEDSPHNRLLIEEYLKKLPYELHIAENGAVALEKFIAGRYDVVLMDLRMPVMDGYTAVRRMRQWEDEQACAPTPILALTASALDGDIRRSVEAGCTAHLSKPVKKAQLLAALREWTNGSSSAAPRRRPERAAQPT